MKLNKVFVMGVKKEKIVEIRISNVSPETLSRFNEIKTDLYSDDKKKTLESLLNIHQFFNFKLSEEEIETLKCINNTLPDVFERKIKQVIEALGVKIKNIDYQDADLSFKNSSKSAFLRIEQLIKELVVQNDNGKDWFDRKYINQKTIFDFSKEKKRLTPSTITVSCRTINQYLAINKDKVDGYNKKYDMGEDHNLKVYYFKKKKKKENKG